MKKCLFLALGMLLVFVFTDSRSTSSAFISATCLKGDCSKYMGKGYCTDYIQQRTGKRQRGDAGSWSSNINNNDVRPGDVAIFTSPRPAGHVAYVERVIYARNTSTPVQVEVTEWNWGATLVDSNCSVTNMFGKTLPRNRVVPVNNVKGFWRP